MRMLSLTSRVLFAAAVIVLCTHAGAAPSDCPTITVACSEDGPTIEFSATVSPENPNLKLTYKWTVSRGEIKSGQGTPKITVDAERNGKGLGATVEVLGLPMTCPNKAGCYRTHF
jgi:hypothetical protein